jgi:hypothetical protein
MGARAAKRAEQREVELQIQAELGDHLELAE